MLQNLHIENIALIDRLDLDFPAGFLVLTGETGAGKSIIIDAVSLILGGRADRTLIQENADKALVEAVFDIDDESQNKLSALGIDTEDGQLILSRELTSSGKNVCRINGRLSGLSMLKEAAEGLIDIHGQHESRGLLLASNHLAFLDEYGKEDLLILKEQVNDTYQKWSKLKRKLTHELGEESERIRMIETLQRQIEEIEKADVSVSEEQKLNNEREIMKYAEQIQLALHSASRLLDAEEGMETEGAMQQTKEAEIELSGISGLQEKYYVLTQRVSDIYYNMEDVLLEIRKLIDETDFDPYRHEEIEERLEVYHILKRKYGSTTETVLSYYLDAMKQLDSLEENQFLAEKGEKELEELSAMLFEQSIALSKERRNQAQKLEKDIIDQLHDLGMEKTQFSIAFSELPHRKEEAHFSVHGLDRIEMMLSTNPGESLKPLHKIASGGELSRIMLAFKTVGAKGSQTLIFDEIDTGISGRIAAVVGQKMRAIARNHQVICVTHSPQIAAGADVHFLIEKRSQTTVKGERARTSVIMLNEQEHVMEVARIMSGESAGKQAIAHAEDLISQFRISKSN